MIKKAILCGLIVTLIFILSVPFSVFSSSRVDLYDAFLDFVYENVSSMQLREKNCYSVRTVYIISLPDNTNEVHPLIVSEYSSYQSVYLIEYGYADIGPIIQSLYLCVGEDNGNFAILDNPFEIIKKVYDFTIFHDIPITEVINIEEVVP
jgi:hypothetical protein